MSLDDLSESYLNVLKLREQRQAIIAKQQYNFQQTLGTQALGTQDTVTTWGDRLDSKDTVGLRRRRFLPDDVAFCPYIGVAGALVDLHTEATYPAKDHVGFVPQRSPGGLTDNS